MSTGAIFVLLAVALSVVAIALAIWRSLRGSEVAEAPPTAEDAPAGSEEELSAARRGCHSRPAYLDREARRELLLLDERLQRRLLEDPGMSPEEWAKIADAVIFVHDRMCPQLAVERFERSTDTEVTAPAQTELGAREVFALLNDQLDPPKRLRLLRELHDLVDADVYVPPEHDES